MRCAVYYRVSHKDNERGISIEVQRESCEAFAASQGWVIVGSYIDDGKSAYTDRLDKRPAFQQLMADAKAKHLDVVLVYKYDRFARKRKVFFPVIDDLEGRGIKVRSATESGDWLAVGLYDLMAEQYSRMLSDRMKDVRRFEAQRGLVVGPVPVGYERVGRLIRPAPAAHAVKLAFDLYCTGDYGSHRITDAMNATGHTMPDGSPFKVTAVEELLRCPIYAGLVECQGETYQGQHEAIIRMEQWERAQAVAQQRSKRRLSPRAERYPLLAGIAVCAACGAPMWASGGSDHPIYACSAHHTRGQGVSPDLLCDGAKSNGAIVEQTVCAWLAALALTPTLLDQVRRLLEQEQRPTLPPIRAIDQELKKLKAAFLADQINAAVYEQRRAVLLAEPLPEPTQRPAIDPDALLALVADLPTLLREAPAQHKRAIVRELLSEVYLRKRRVIALRPTRLAEALGSAATQHMTALNEGANSWAGWAPGIGASYQVYDPVVWLDAA